LVRGLYTSASGALVAQSVVDNVANNLANVNTTGFKQTLMQIESSKTFDIYRIQTDPGQVSGNPLPGVPVAQYVGVLGTGSQIYDTPTSYDEGALQTTGNPLDVAIAGNQNAFFSIQTPNGVRYTRDGQFVVNAQGTLVTQDGNAVLSSTGQPINIPLVQATGGNAVPGAPVTISSAGTISQNGVTLGQLQLTQFTSLLNLRPEGSNYYAISGNAGPGPAAPSTIIEQGFLEKSNANVIRSMVDLITAERWFDANEKSIKTQDDAVQSAISQVAKSS
jgi:flagellar basal-body rod protein FlgF